MSSCCFFHSKLFPRVWLLFLVRLFGNVHYLQMSSDRGILGFKRGAILISLCWVAILVHIVDRKWWQAALWALVSAMLSAIGIIHVPVGHIVTHS
ncbi:unnamed protein product [Ascophyllum nodosum]